jgi:nitroreductase
MDTLDAIRTVRVIRKFSQTSLTEDETHTIVNAARRAGSSKNLQRWEFIVVRDRATLGRLSKVGPYAGHLAGASVAIAMLVPRPADGSWVPDESVMWDLGRAAQNMVLAAWNAGIGSAPATVYDEPLCRTILDYPEDRYCGYVWSFGRPQSPSDLTRPPKAGGRRDLDEMLHLERWETFVSADQA